MEGKLGALFIDGVQVGGFIDWAIDTIFNESANHEGQTTRSVACWHLCASSYWLYEQIKGSITARIYLGGSEYWEGKCRITNPTRKVFDTLIHENLEIVGEGVLEGKS
jgi:hypothetical protein